VVGVPGCALCKIKRASTATLFAASAILTQTWSCSSEPPRSCCFRPSSPSKPAAGRCTPLLPLLHLLFVSCSSALGYLRRCRRATAHVTSPERLRDAISIARIAPCGLLRRVRISYVDALVWGVGTHYLHLADNLRIGLFDALHDVWCCFEVSIGY
jgi:hypothetical protein